MKEFAMCVSQIFEILLIWIPIFASILNALKLVTFLNPLIFLQTFFQKS